MMSDWLVGDFVEEVVVELSLEGRIGAERAFSAETTACPRPRPWTAQLTEDHKLLNALDHRVHGDVMWMGSGHKDPVY